MLVVLQQLELSRKKNALAIAKKRTYDESSVVDEDGKQLTETSELERNNAHYLVEFSLGLLHVKLKRSNQKLSEDDAEMLDSLVDLLLECLKSREDKMIELSLKVMSLLVPRKLPAMNKCAKEFAKTVFRIMSQSGSSTDLTQVCYRCVAVILRDLPVAKVTDTHLRLLVQFIMAEVDQQGTQQTSFILLKSIISRKLLSPEVYDCVDAVFKLLIQSQDSSVRSTASQLLLIFLLEYPLGPKRLRQHIDFLTSNLEYDLESGREAALGMINTIVLKFPDKVLLEHAEYFFVSISTRLVSDRSTKCRSKAASLLKSLYSRVLAADKPMADKFNEYAMVWYADDRPGLTRVAAQLVGLAVDVEKVAFEKRLGGAVTAITACLERELAKLEGGGAAAEGGGDDIVAESPELDESESWQNIYHSLRAVEKLMGVLPAKVEGPACQPLWEAIIKLLRHPHMWVENVSSRILGLAFSRCTPPTQESPSDELTQSLCGGAVVQLDTATHALCTQLQSELLDESVAEQAVKGLVFIARVYNGKRDAVVSDTEDGGVEQREPSEHDVSHPLQSLFRRIARIARQTGAAVMGGGGDFTPSAIVRRASCLRWLAAVAMLVGKDKLLHQEQMVPQIITAFFHLLPQVDSNGGDNNPMQVPEELVNLAQQVSDALKNLVGVAAFTEAFSGVRSKIEATRSDRKRARAVSKFLDPEAAAKKKVHKNELKKASKKRRVEGYKVARGKERYGKAGS